MKTIALLLGAFLLHYAAADAIRVLEAERKVDITTQLVKVGLSMTVQNDGKSEVGRLSFLLTEDEANHVAHLTASTDRKHASVSKEAKAPEPGFAAYTLTLGKKIPAGGSLVLNVDYQLVQTLVPFPAKIAQDETQFVVYSGNAAISSAYAIETQKTTVVYGSGKMQSFTQAAPSKQLGDKIVYGPYTNEPTYSLKPIKVHYENVSPFIVATRVDRVIEISHWGNIAVEEYVEIIHKGAELIGPFSRLDFQIDRRGSKQPCVKQYKTVLPASARDIYYRDEIGNISTSSVRVRAESVEVEIRPRFPLFGGWRTSYVLGYNVPSYEYLHSDGDRFGLRMRLLDHIYDNAVIEKLTTRIILPELASDMELVTPYSVKRLPNERHATYLDTVGRPVIVVEKENLVDAHIQSFTLTYNWNRSLIIREPFLASAFFFILLLAVVIYVRVDFNISKDAGAEARLGVAAKLDSLYGLFVKRNKLHDSLLEAVAKFKETRNTEVITTTRRRLESERAEVAEKISATLGEVKTSAPAVAERLAELEKQEKSLVEGEKAYVDAASKATGKNAVEDRQWAARLLDTRNKIEAVFREL